MPDQQPTAAAAAPQGPAPPVPGPVPTKYPQYGVLPSTGQIAVAHDSAEKVADIDKGFVVWFQTRSEATSWYSSQHGFGSGQINFSSLIPGLSGLEEIGHFIGSLVSHLTDVYMWISLGWIALGIVLLVVGILMWLRKADLIPSVVPVPV